jgi:hypothetical protein
MKAEVNYIPFETFQEIIIKSGLPFEELAGFVKVSGQKGRKIYIPRTQRVGRVDISGFEYPGRGVVALDDDDRWGSVTQQLDFSGDQEETLENFVAVLEHMAKLPPVESRTRSPQGSARQEAQGQATGRERRGRPSMTTQLPQPGPSRQEKAVAAQAAQNEPAAKRGRRGTQQGRARR